MYIYIISYHIIYNISMYSSKLPISLPPQVFCWTPWVRRAVACNASAAAHSWDAWSCGNSSRWDLTPGAPQKNAPFLGDQYIYICIYVYIYIYLSIHPSIYIFIFIFIFILIFIYIYNMGHWLTIYYMVITCYNHYIVKKTGIWLRYGYIIWLIYG